MLRLKEYQEHALADLRAYLDRADIHQSGAKGFVPPPPYNELAGFGDIPYICLRLPTGAGKTLLACHSIGIARSTYYNDEIAPTCVVLWLVPSDAILQQTLSALKNRNHPYRQVLEADFPNAVNIMDVKQALYAGKSQYQGRCNIIVSTLQAFRIIDKEGRRVYRQNSGLMNHFTHFEPEEQERIGADIQEKLVEEGDVVLQEDGKLVYSLANVLALYRPLLLVDEAHNASTAISLLTFKRFNPAAIFEFTATPVLKGASRSNLVHTASALALKHEEMIRLPILLETDEEWENVILKGIQKRNELEEIAQKEREQTGEYIRPILLIKCGNINSEQNVHAIKELLMQRHNIGESKIGIAYKEIDELKDIDLMSESCPIEYILTVDKLREGWDCPFAYILATVTEMRSDTAIEQLVGRVLRMPNAKRKTNEALNNAYIMASGAQFTTVLSTLHGKLVQKHGFEEIDERDLFRNANQSSEIQLPNSSSPTLFDTEVATQPKFSPSLPSSFNVKAYQKLDVALKDKVRPDIKTGYLHFSGEISPKETEALIKCVKPEHHYVIHQAASALSNNSFQALSPVEKGEIFEIPQLVYKQTELFEESHIFYVLGG